MDSATRGQILDGIFHDANTIGKGMNLTILPPDLCKIIEPSGFFSLDRIFGFQEEKLWIQAY